MKRSDAIKIIGRVLVFGPQGLDKDKQKKYEDKSLADIVLCELEEAGMKPPFVSLDSMKNGYVWEPEDETK